MNEKDTQLAALVAEAELGEEARKFLESDLYRFMVGAAGQEADSALQALAEIDPRKTDEIQDLQYAIRRAGQFEAWLRELVSKGDNAIATYQQQTE